VLFRQKEAQKGKSKSVVVDLETKNNLAAKVSQPKEEEELKPDERLPDQ
jgi:hypothetical protein